MEIIKSRTIWLSAYYALNDSLERSWGFAVFEKTLSQLKDEVGKEFSDAVRAMVIVAYTKSLVMIGSYSLDRDLLSQWRAYADDGRGFAIGFSKGEMLLPAKPLRVLYDEKAQAQELIGNIRHTYGYEKSIGFRFDEEFQSHCFNIGMDLCAYKHSAFKDEKEIRLVHASGLARNGKATRVISLGARDQDGRKLSEPIEVRFRVGRGIVTPYVALDYTNGGSASPIKEVLLGPRNENSESNIQLLLNASRATDTDVRRSSIPYR